MYIISSEENSLSIKETMVLPNYSLIKKRQMAEDSDSHPNTITADVMLLSAGENGAIKPVVINSGISRAETQVPSGLPPCSARASPRLVQRLSSQ